MNFDTLYKRFRSFNLENVLFKTFSDAGIKSFIIELNKERQLFAKGIGVNGEIVGYYSFVTSLINPSKKFNSPYNFKDTGEMFRSFRVIVDKQGFTIDADAEKLVDSNIIDKESQILGLTNESKAELVKEIAPQIAEQIRNALLS